MEQVIQVAGAVLILLAFAATQARRMSPHSLAYLMLNFVGSAVLAVLALLDEDWGFVLLEVVWALVSAWGLLALARATQKSASF